MIKGRKVEMMQQQEYMWPGLASSRVTAITLWASALWSLHWEWQYCAHSPSACNASQTQQWSVSHQGDRSYGGETQWLRVKTLHLHNLPCMASI